jgi:hypothetical protein
MDVSKFIIGIGWFVIAHVAVFFQLNGQFKWDWFKNNEWIVATSGIAISFFYIWGTKYIVEGLDGMLWPARFVGFSVGMVIYALGVSYFFKEGITNKTFISLLLCIALVLIQLFWKTK